MKKITEEQCIELMKKKFLKFHTYWENYLRDFGLDLGLHIQILPFGKYTIDLIKLNNEKEIKKIFNFVEFLLINGDETVQHAMTTSFLEYLMSKDPDEIRFRICAKYLGENSKGYCKAWDKFTGCKTDGLWGDEK